MRRIKLENDLSIGDLGVGQHLAERRTARRRPFFVQDPRGPLQLGEQRRDAAGGVEVFHVQIGRR